MNPRSHTPANAAPAGGRRGAVRAVGARWRASVAVGVMLSLLAACGGVHSDVGTSSRAAAGPASASALGAGRAGSVAAPSAAPASGDPLLVGGRLDQATLTGARSHYTAMVDVWTPPGYDPNSARKYPVLLALHGWPGWPRMLYDNLKLLRTVDQVAAAHRMAWPVVVMPRWGLVDTECTDADADHRSETWLADDLTAWVRQHYNVQADRSGWASYGYSAGAYCASMLAMHHPDEFGAGVAMSGYSQPSFEAPYVPFAPGSTLARRYDLARQASDSAPDVALYEVCDPDDRESYPSLSRLLQAAHAPTRLTTVQASGGHAVALWIPANAVAFAWLGRTLAGFAPA